jgi:hypothetical protein
VNQPWNSLFTVRSNFGRFEATDTLVLASESAAMDAPAHIDNPLGQCETAVVGCELVRSPASPAQFSSPLNTSRPSMSAHPNVDRESFQNFLASAFRLQQGGKSPSRTISQDTATADRETDESLLCNAEITPPVSISRSSDALAATSLALDACLPSFQALPRKAKTSLLQSRYFLTPSLLILSVAMALLLGWMLRQVFWRPIAEPKLPTLVRVAPAVLLRREESTQVHKRAQASGSRRPRSVDEPRDSLVVYENGRVIFRLKSGEDVTSAADQKVRDRP